MCPIHHKKNETRYLVQKTWYTSCLTSCQTTGSQKISKYQKNFKLGWTHSIVPSLPSRNQTLVIAVKKHAKIDTKLFFSCPVSLDFFILFQIFCPRLQFFNKVLFHSCILNWECKNTQNQMLGKHLINTPVLK